LSFSGRRVMAIRLWVIGRGRPSLRRWPTTEIPVPSQVALAVGRAPAQSRPVGRVEETVAVETSVQAAPTVHASGAAVRVRAVRVMLAAAPVMHVTRGGETIGEASSALVAEVATKGADPRGRTVPARRGRNALRSVRGGPKRDQSPGVELPVAAQPRSARCHSRIRKSSPLKR